MFVVVIIFGIVGGCFVSGAITAKNLPT